MEIKENISPAGKEKLDKHINGSYADFVRLERRNLLLFSGIILISAFAGFSPDNFSFSGASFSNLNEAVYFSILAIVTFYFLVAFVIFSYPNYREAIVTKAELTSSSHTLEYSIAWYMLLATLWKTNDIRYFSWIAMQYVLPCMLGIIAVFCAIFEAIFSVVLTL